MRPRSAAAAMMLMLAVAAAAHWRGDRSQIRAKTVRFVSGRRPFALRLSGSRAWTPCSTPVGLDTVAVRCENYVLDAQGASQALELAHSAAREAGSRIDAEWTLTIVDMLPRRRASTSGVHASERLEKLVAIDSTDAELRNDLAVAYLSEGRSSGVFMSLQQIERAWAIDSTSSVIAFNRALILTEAHLSEEARVAWDRYLNGRTESGWRNEAERWRSVVDSRLGPRLFDGRPATIISEAQRDPQHAREFVIDSLLPRWATVTSSGNNAAAESICAWISLIGSEIRRNSSDGSVVSLANDCRSGRMDVATAMLELTDGNEHFRRGDFAPAARALSNATSHLRARGANAIADWSAVTEGFIHIYAGRHFTADSVFAAVERDAASRGDSALKARALWGRALSAARDGADAIDYYSNAAEIYRALREPLNRAAMISQASDMLLSLGRDEQALNGKLEALSLFDRRLDTRPRSGSFVALGLELVDLGLPAAGAAVLREAATAARSSERPNDAPEALIQLANAEIASGREASGRSHLGAAERAFGAIKDTLMLQRQQMAAALARATLDSARAPRAALAELDQVEAYYRKTNLQYNRALPLARRGRQRLRLGQLTEARRDMEAAVAAIESPEPVAADPLAAREQAAARREVYESLMALDIAQHDTIAAFLVAEHARGNRVEHAPSIERGRVVLSYFALPDRLLLWIVNDRGVRLRAVPLTPSQLRARARDVEALVRAGDDTPEWRALSRQSFDELIGPAESALGEARTITIVPDGSLGRLPFAALRDSTGRYLVERAVLTYAVAMRPASAFRSPVSTTVVVGHPNVDSRNFPELAPLPGAAREVDAVRRAYPRAVALVDAEATKAAVARAMQRATLFHFAGHARLVDRAPSLSHLVLAGDGQGGIGSGLMTAAEISHLDLRRMDLAVLSSCGTTQEHSRWDPAQSGLSLAFLAAGAHSVISSRWEVDDAGTAELMERFYSDFSRGVPASVALNRAQVALLNAFQSTHPLWVWSAFAYEER